MRTRNSMKNIITGLALQIITIGLSLLSRKIFIDNIGIEFVGINGLLTSIVYMLSVVELGVGGAIYYSLYKPIAKKDYNQVTAIMNLYSKIYKLIGISVAILGLVIMPFLKYIMHINISSTYANTVYIIFLSDSVISYFLTYRRNILSADQKNYVLNKLSIIFTVSTQLLQILIIITTKSYILYLVVKVILGIIQNLIIYFITNKRYPYLKERKGNKPILKKEVKDDIIKNAKALFIMNISSYLVFGTDNILVSIFAGVTSVGIYSNYNLIISTIIQFIGQVFNGIKASVGNYMVEEKNENIYQLFRKMYFLNFCIVSFASVSLIVLTNLFIGIWVGVDNVWPLPIVVILVFNMYSRAILSSIGTVKDAAGLFSPYPFFKYWALSEGIVNLVSSVFIAKILNQGIYGVFVGTSISTVVSTIVMPRVVYRCVFKKSVLPYFKLYGVYMLLTILYSIITYSIFNIIHVNSKITYLFIGLILCVIVPNAITTLLFWKTEEFNYYKNLLLRNLVEKPMFKRLK